MFHHMPIVKGKKKCTFFFCPKFACLYSRSIKDLDILLDYDYYHTFLVYYLNFKGPKWLKILMYGMN